MLSRVQIKKKAEELLAQNHIGMPPVSVEAVAESLGVAIQRVDLKDNLSGFSYPKGPRRTIGVNLRHATVRQRFTVAHELGHLLMHTQDLHYDRAFSMQFRSEISSTGTDPKEVAANAFAAELLMPEAFLKRDLREFGSFDIENDPRVLDELADRYDVSKQAMVVRLANLAA